MSHTKKFTFAPLPSTVRGESVKLEVDPKGKTFVYTNEKSVFMRDLENPSLATEYTGHGKKTTVARYSPSGYYMASGDVSGNVRIWDTVNEEHILKNECRPISGKINDIAWDGESKRVIAVGVGKEFFGSAFFFDSSASVGEISGHSNAINSVSIRQERPFRAVTASDDRTVCFFTGVPFKYKNTIQDHSNFVHSVQFSPNGHFFATAGADRKIFLYNGETGEKIDELTTADDSHSGGIFALAWSPDSTQILSSSADQTAKIWDINGKSVVNTFRIDSAVDAIDNQQVGNLWKGDYLITASLSGEFSYLDKNSGKVSRRIDGHSKAITALAVSEDDTFFTGSFDGRVFGWRYGAEGDHTFAEPVVGEGHKNQVTCLSFNHNELLSVAMDDTIRHATTDFKFSEKIVNTGSIPSSIAVSENKTTVVATKETVIVYDDKLEKMGQLENLTFTPSVADISPDGKNVYVGGQENMVVVYELSNGSFTEAGELSDVTGDISALATHPKLNLIAVGNGTGQIFIYDTETKTRTIRKWVYHTGRITSLNWSKCGQFLVSGSFDTNIYIWDRENTSKKVAITNAHFGGVNSVRFLNNSSGLSVASVGQDAAIRVWDVLL